MEIVFFSHPFFSGHKSMSRFVKMLAKGMKDRGHTVEILEPAPLFYKLLSLKSMKKWMGYIDQYLVFPRSIRKKLKSYPPNTLFVFTDQALGPWVPLVANRFHVIHCHDFLAQLSALGEISENLTRWPGRQYQAYIRRGFTKGKNFISVSKKTKEDLNRFLPANSSNSAVVYNGLNNSFEPFEPIEAGSLLGNRTGLYLSAGYLLHVGGNQWYKNRPGVIEIYNAWRSSGLHPVLPLILIGEDPSPGIREKHEQSPFKEDIHFLTNIEDEYVRFAYAGASVFLFPSIAEGFGWPIAEAMACGCPVITTNKVPMTEIAGKAGFYIPGRPENAAEITLWASASAKVIDQILQLSSAGRQAVVKEGIENAKRFDTKNSLNQIEEIYSTILQAPIAV